MSEENIRVVQSFFDAFLAGEPSRAEPLVDSQFEFVPSNASHIPAPVAGLKEFTRRVAEMANQFDQYAAVAERLIDAGDDQVVVSLRRTAKSQGVQVEDRLAQVYTLRAGRISRIDAFQTLAEALEAAGVSE
jgi:ketosteroid isomerase-like protein